MTKKITWVSSATLAWQTTCMMKLRSPWKIIKTENGKVKQDNNKVEENKKPNYLSFKILLWKFQGV